MVRKTGESIVYPEKELKWPPERFFVGNSQDKREQGMRRTLQRFGPASFDFSSAEMQTDQRRRTCLIIKYCGQKKV